MRWLLGALAALALVGADGAQAAVRLSVTPARALVDIPVDIQVTGLAAGGGVTLEATARDTNGSLWRSRIAYHADARGVLDTHSNMQLFWSLRPADTRASSLSRFSLPDPFTVEISATSTDAPTTVHATLVRRISATGLRITHTTLASQGFVGTYYALAPGRARPAILALAGSNGGQLGFSGALLASHGYPSLTLGYFKEPGLPQTLKDIPLEYFANALRWLAAQPGVDPRRLIVLGISRGGEAALILGVTYPTLVRGVIACTTSANVLGAFPGPGTAWSLAGKPLPYAPIPVERIDGPVLVTGGGKDAILRSDLSVKEIVRRARAHGRNNITGRIYPQAGHGAGCRIPNLPIASTMVKVGPSTFTDLGGTPAAYERSAAASWPRLLHFIATLPG